MSVQDWERCRDCEGAAANEDNRRKVISFGAEEKKQKIDGDSSCSLQTICSHHIVTGGSFQKFQYFLLRYGWTQQAVAPRSPPRNWTSLDLAKPLWEEVKDSKSLSSKSNDCLYSLIGQTRQLFNTLLLCTGGRQRRGNQFERLQTRASPTVGLGRG